MQDSNHTVSRENESITTGDGQPGDSLPLNLDLEGFITAVENQARPLVIPLCAEIALPRISPEVLYLRLRKGTGFLLESMEGGEKIARYSFIGLEPKLILSIGRTVKTEGDPQFIEIAKKHFGKAP